MSHYISSFLIEPVIRQARRFSRPGNGSRSPPPASLRRSHGNDERLQHSNELEVATLADEAQGHIVFSGSPHASPRVICGEPQVESPASEAGADELEAELQAWRASQGVQTPLWLTETDSEAEVPAVSASRNRSASDNTSENPRHRIPNSLRSYPSSFSSSLRSVVDGNMIPGGDSVNSPRLHRQNTSGSTISYSFRNPDGSLPEDDGMGHMRKRIIAIQRTESSNAEKARLIHGVMTEQYNSSQPSLIRRSHSPASTTSHERPMTPVSAHSVESRLRNVSNPTHSSPLGNAIPSFHLTTEDLQPTYFRRGLFPHGTGPNGARPSRQLQQQQVEPSDFDDEPPALGCPHYKRNIKLQCSACDLWYTCRFCHDEVEDHSLNRRETKNMLCMLCGCAQPAAETCRECGEPGARYYCSVCKLWDDDSEKSIYHCEGCGICRVGQGLGKDFYHCKICCVCISISIRDTHRCIERSTDCDCPICGEYMFTSPQAVVFMRCGHSIHHLCYYEHIKNSYRCPICSRSIANMEMQFRHLERAIDTQPMPAEFQDTKAWVYCNDCSAKTIVKYHWLGLKCAVCDSYNTAQIQILSGPDSEETIPPELLDAPEHPTSQSRPPSRGRAIRPAGLIRRTTNSAPPPAETIEAPPAEPSRRGVRSQSPCTTGPLALGLSSWPNDVGTEDDIESTNSEESEVDFWGRTSPSSRKVELAQKADEAESEDGSSGDDDDDDDENMSDDDEIEEDEIDDGDRMEIFGHR